MSRSDLKRRNKKLKDDEVVRMRKVRVKLVAHEDDWEATNSDRKEMINDLLNRMFGNYRFLYNSCVKLDQEGQIYSSTKEKDKWRINVGPKASYAGATVVDQFTKSRTRPSADCRRQPKRRV